ncbi:hypothetical protein SAMN05421831_101356 [Allopseudospirillum japonicum]|uniref:Uncharacterized protein n=1 Tax=Allopseudospirillum japonicum TaxID=64971 RepID=A0A1H6QPA7_9GAMM|nr:hypothetical protein [Allopseudospirillum japonicum]SEI41095.1 hypothetical protein SAMN05421831_101356 [Allopseudospirillum japonicum]
MAAEDYLIYAWWAYGLSALILLWTSWRLTFSWVWWIRDPILLTLVPLLAVPWTLAENSPHFAPAFVISLLDALSAGDQGLAAAWRAGQPLVLGIAAAWLLLIPLAWRQFKQPVKPKPQQDRQEPHYSEQQNTQESLSSARVADERKIKQEG